MGGTITVGVRYLHEGVNKCVFMHRWTNDIPWRVMQPDFVSGGAGLTEFLEDGNPEKSDYDPGYCELLPELCSSEYGVILFDFITREIWSRNEYTTAGVKTYIAGTSTADLQERAGLVELCKLNLIGEVAFWDIQADEQRENPWEVKTVEDFLNYCEGLPKDDTRIHRQPMWKLTLAEWVFRIDWSDKHNSGNDLSDTIAWMQARGWETTYEQALKDAAAEREKYLERSKEDSGA